MKKRTKVLIRLACILGAFALTAVIAVIGINAYVTGSVQDRILPPQAAAELSDFDCILVLGCKVNDNGTPSAMLDDRLRRGIELFELGAAPKLLMSGDHGRTDYDEVNTMKAYAVDAGISSQDVFMDHAGFSTYESIYRAKEIFQADKILIVTQEYHLYRALYLAQSLGLDAYGVASDYRAYYGQTARDIREVLARVKDFGASVFRPLPTYLGEIIPISGDGNLTNDKNSYFS